MKCSRMIGVVALCVLSAGCAAAPAEEERGSSSSALNEPGDNEPANRAGIHVFRVQSYTNLVSAREFVTYPHYLKEACGGDYHVDVTVRLGRVTSDSIEIRSFTATYHPKESNNYVVPNYVRAFSPGASITVPDQFPQLGRRDGVSSTYEINKVFPARNGAAVIVGHMTGGAIDSGLGENNTCANEMFLHLYAPR